MKKLTLLIAVLLTGYLSAAQDCGSYIELLGSGISGQDAASILVGENDNIDSISAEVIYKSTTAPTQVRLWSDNEEIFVEPVDVKISGKQGEGVITSVFRATFTQPADEINLDILNNSTEFYSMALYVFRNNGLAVSYMEGELYHVYQNEDSPLLIDIPVQVSDHPRNITLRFGISELNEDERWAEFIFEANGDIKNLEIWEWDSPAGETDSYTIQEVTFIAVAGNVDHIKMTMRSDNHEPDTLKGDSYIAGVVLVDIPCEYEESTGYCTYTQGYYGNKGGKTCAGESTHEVLSRLLYEDLILGAGDSTFTIPAGAVDCVLDILPGGGPSKSLTGNFSCDDLGNIATNKQGRLKNSLLSQGITLALNLRNSRDLLTFPVDGLVFQTRRAADCMSPESAGIHGTEKTHVFGEEVVTYLGANASIEDLLALVNKALSGADIIPLTLSMVADAASVVNEAFDECVVVLNQADMDSPEIGDDDGDDDGDKAGNKGSTGISENTFGAGLSLFPNPAKDQISVQTKETGKYSIEISSLNGQILHNYDFSGDFYQIDISSLRTGVYFIRIRTEDHISTRRIVKL